MARPSFTLAMQGPFAPEAGLVGRGPAAFATVAVAGNRETDTAAEVYVATLAEADAFIAAFTEARRLLVEQGVA